MSTTSVPDNGLSQSLQSNQPLSSTGQLQHSRQLVQLSNNHFSVEERDFADWIDYLRKIGPRIRFFELESQAAKGHWAQGLPSRAQCEDLALLMQGGTVSAAIHELASRPDIATLMAFYQMLRYPLEQFKRFTARHLQHYYTQVLGFKLRPGIADSSHLVLTLADEVDTYTLPAGTQFDAGVDAAGKPLVYQTQSAALLNQAQLDRVFTVSKQTENGQLLVTRLIDQDLAMPTQGGLSFGEAQQVLETERYIQPAQGVKLSSGALYLSGGDRKLTLDFQLKQGEQLPDFDLLALFDIKISTSEGVLPLAEQTAHITLKWLQELGQLTIHLKPLFPAVTHDELSTSGSLPFLQFSLKKESLEHPDASVFEQLSRLRTAIFSRLSLSIDVQNLTGVVASQANYSLDTETPFTPFGNNPVIGGRLDFTHPELLLKPIDSAQLHFSWLNRPANFDTHYASYLGYLNKNKPIENKLSKWPDSLVQLYHSDHEQPVGSAQSLFSDNHPVDNIDHHTINIIGSHQHAVWPIDDLPRDVRQANAWPKWYSLTLHQWGLGHDIYSSVSQYTAYLNTRIFQDDKAAQPIEVLPPYTPELNALSISYRTQVTFTVVDPLHQMHYLQPLGQPAIPLSNKGFALLPEFSSLGELYLGFSKVTTPSHIRLYMQLDAVDGVNLKQPHIDWHYLTDTGWQFFDSQDSQGAKLVEDTTFKLLDSGVMVFDLPQLTDSRNYIDPDRLWLRASLRGQLANDNSGKAGLTAYYSRIRQAFAQGVKVTLKGGEYHPSHYTQPLPAEQINALVVEQAEISQVQQPFPSFGGRAGEDMAQLSVRASERLRHKNRAVTAWDFERLVLDQFPELYRVQCYASPIQNIDARLVVVPKNHNPEVLRPTLPLYLKRQIQLYLSGVSQLVTEVTDPIYEEVQLEVFAQISAEYDIEGVESELNQLLNNNLTPWNRSASQVEVSQDIYMTDLSNLLEQHPALVSVYVMRAMHTYIDTHHVQRQKSYRDMTEYCISPSRPDAILVPAETHKITLFNRYQEVFEGIGKWRLQLDFKVN